MKVNTVEQFKILEYLKNNFQITELKLDIVDRNSIKITDVNQEFITFKFENGQVISNNLESVIENNSSERDMKEKVKKEAYNIKECAEILGICENKMRELIYRRSNPAPSIKVGRRIIVPCQAFHTWVNLQAISNNF